MLAQCWCGAQSILFHAKDSFLRIYAESQGRKGIMLFVNALRHFLKHACRTTKSLTLSTEWCGSTSRAMLESIVKTSSLRPYLR